MLCVPSDVEPVSSDFRLIFQHLLYKSVVKDYDAAGDMGVVTMDEQDAYALGEVVVSAERPLVKAENGALTYDVEALAEKTTASNAYEALTRLPGVWEQGGSPDPSAGSMGAGRKS